MCRNVCRALDHDVWDKDVKIKMKSEGGLGSIMILCEWMCDGCSEE